MIWTKGADQSAKFQTFDRSREISPNLYFDRLLFLKVYKVSAKKVQWSYVSWHWRVMQNLKKNQLICCVKNDKNLVNFDPSTWKSKQFALWLVPFVQSIQCLTYKSTEELSFMTLKRDAKCEENLTCGLKNNIRNLANFYQSTWKCQNRDFDGILCPN